MTSEELVAEGPIKEAEHYQVLITGIHWDRKTTSQYKVKNDNYDLLPSQFTLDISDLVLKQANKNKEEFNDVIESHCYNFLTRKFGHEVNRCQIWLPLEEES